MLRKKCKDASKKKRTEKLAKEKAEEDLFIMKNNLTQFKNSLEMKAKSKNENGFNKAKKNFDLEFTRLKEVDVEKVFKNQIAVCENLILDTYNMFKCDIINISTKAECIIKNADLEYSSFRSKAHCDIENIYKPLVGVEYQTTEKFYTVKEDWHDIQLRIYLELKEIAKTVGISFNWSFDCTWIIGVCPKCSKTNILNSNPKRKDSTMFYENNQPISKKNNPSISIRKRKPMNLTMEDLEGANGDDSDYEAYFCPGDMI